jgi:FkbM family methyltransferase
MTLPSDIERNYGATELSAVVEEQINGDFRERAEVDYLPKLLADCDRFIDVGANIGQYMFFANRSLKNAEIIGIEANPYLISTLRAVCQRAATEAPRGNRFEVIHCAVSNSNSPIQFSVSDNVTTSSIFSGDETSNHVRVESRFLDDFFDSSKKIIIKMDIEGAEYRAISSAKEFLASKNTRFFLELHGWGDVSLRKYPIHLLNLFFARGYACRQIGSHHLFYRAALGSRIAGYLANFPELFAKSVVHRYMKGLVPLFRRLRYG